MIEAETVLAFGGILLNLAIIIVLTTVAIVITRLILKRFLWPAVKKTESKADDRILRLLENFLIFYILILGIQQAINLLSGYFGFEVQFSDDFFFLLYWGIAVYTIFRIITNASEWYLSKVPLKDREEIDQRVIHSVKYIFFLILSFLALIVLLEHFGITGPALTASLTALGIGGIIIGFAAQTTLADMIIGVVLLIDRPFRIGDRIRLEKLDTWGDVIEIGWRSTRILTRDNRLVIIPNSIIGKDMVTNYSIPEKHFRIETELVILSGPDIENIRKLILEALENETWIIRSKPVQVLFLGFADLGIKLRVRCWIENYMETRVLEDRLNTVVYNVLINTNVKMPSSIKR
jgi:small-conductance mechanosensitive channel